MAVPQDSPLAGVAAGAIDQIPWQHIESDGFVKSATAFIDLDPPRSNPVGPSTTLFLQVEEDEDTVEFHWRFTTEDEENWGNNEHGSGSSSELEQAKSDCFAEAVTFLAGEGYLEREIAAAL